MIADQDGRVWVADWGEYGQVGDGTTGKKSLLFG